MTEHRALCRVTATVVLLLIVAARARSAAGAEEARQGYLVVASRAALPILRPLLDLRRQHCNVSILTINDLVPSGDALTPSLLKRAIRKRHTADGSLTYVLVAGDTRRGSDGLPAIPTHPQGFDAWYGILDTDDPAAGEPALHRPAMAVGRFPATSARELQAMVNKTVAYETRSTPGPWQRQVHAIAGTANFGPVADALVDHAVTLVLDRAIPPAYSLTVTRALTSSPYAYPPDEFEGRVMKLFEDGALVVTYVGHGKTREAHKVSGFMTGTVMDCGTMRRLRCRPGRRPIAVFVACSMGRADGRRESVAEAALRSPGGPVACVASTRRNHVYGNAVFGLELTRAFFDAREPTLGRCVLRAQRRLVHPQGAPDPIRLALNALALADPKARVPKERHADLLVQHVYLYGLLGDPALRLARPSLAVHSLRAALAADRSHWTVEGLVQGMQQGSALVTLEVPRPVISGTLEPVSPGDKGWRDAMRRNYAAANTKVVAQVRTELKGGRFRATLPAPPSRQPGAYAIKIIAWNSRHSALGATQVTCPPPATPHQGSVR